MRNEQFKGTSSLFILTSWYLILAIQGFGTRHLTRAAPFLRYANEAVLPFYVMYQTVLLTVGYVVVQWPVPDPVKWYMIAAISLGSILGLYEYLVSRVNVLRFLFGIKPLRQVHEAAAQPEPVPASR